MSTCQRIPSKLALGLCATLVLTSACRHEEQESAPDRPRISQNVALRDVTFRSAALNRDMRYRVVMPASISPGSKLPVIYLLHGANGGFRDWSSYTDVARFAERGLILVMPDADNSSTQIQWSIPKSAMKTTSCAISSPMWRHDSRQAGPAQRAILGISMGGFGAIKLSLHHPELFSFAGGLSSAIDVPNRPFSMKRIGQWRQHRAIFGAWGSPTRHENDPFVLARSVDPAISPYFYLTCGDAEGLLPSNRSFAHLLDERRFRYEFHVVPGGHDWNQWNARLEDCFSSLLRHLG